MSNPAFDDMPWCDSGDDMKEPPVQPCPFCGEKSITMSYFNQPATKLAASCPACLAMGPIVDRWSDPFEAWNKRATSVTNGDR